MRVWGWGAVLSLIGSHTIAIAKMLWSCTYVAALSEHRLHEQRAAQRAFALSPSAVVCYVQHLLRLHRLGNHGHCGRKHRGAVSKATPFYRAGERCNFGARWQPGLLARDQTGTAGKVGWALTSSPGHEADAACGNAGRACVSQASFEGAKGEGRQWDKGQILRCHSAVRGQLRRHRSRQSACGVFREEAWQHAPQAGEAGGPAREKAGERIRTAHGLCNGVLLERWQLWQSDGRVSDIQYVCVSFLCSTLLVRYERITQPQLLQCRGGAGRSKVEDGGTACRALAQKRNAPQEGRGATVDDQPGAGALLFCVRGQRPPRALSTRLPHLLSCSRRLHPRCPKRAEWCRRMPQRRAFSSHVQYCERLT